MRTTISKSWRFDAAHHLPHHDGKCQRLHGHTYTLSVGVTGEPQPIDGRPQEGMVIDFGELDRIWKAYLEPDLDHRDLNETVTVPRTTSELLAAYAYDLFADQLAPMDVAVEFVRVSETASTWAEVRG